jgi:CheY-like chemotaxis protein/HPt (histidine-containing phosphotransfer) domain-containing protein
VPERALAALARTDAGQQPYSLAIVDSLMPGMDGFEAARRIRHLAPDLPVVMLASDTERGDELRRLEAGILGFALKPVNRIELLHLISTALHVSVGARASAALAEPHSVRRNLSLLVAEDVADNRVLIDAYLKDAPYGITFADDGRHALELFTAGRFDLALMDIHMPVMDGLEATRAIRAFESEEARTPTPIIAITADARPEDIESSRLAGCNDHVSKPISRRALMQAIERVMRETSEGATGRGDIENAQIEAPNGLEALAPAYLEGPRRGVEQAADLLAEAIERVMHETSERASGKEDVENAIQIEVPDGLEALAPAYLEARRRDVKEAAELLAGGDFGRLIAMAHNMKGNGSSYGFPLITELGGSLEQSARAGDQEASKQHLAALRNYLKSVHLSHTR